MTLKDTEIPVIKHDYSQISKHAFIEPYNITEIKCL